MKAEHAANEADVEILQTLNGDYVRSVQMSDVRRFNEILASRG